MSVGVQAQRATTARQQSSRHRRMSPSLLPSLTATGSRRAASDNGHRSQPLSSRLASRIRPAVAWRLPRWDTHTARQRTESHSAALQCSALHLRSISVRCCARRLTESRTGKMARWVGLAGVSDGVSNQKHKHELACMHQYLKFTFERFVVLCLTGPNGQERKREKKANFVRSLLCCSRSVIRRTGLSGWVCVRDSRVVPLQAV